MSLSQDAPEGCEVAAHCPKEQPLNVATGRPGGFEPTGGKFGIKTKGRGLTVKRHVGSALVFSQGRAPWKQPSSKCDDCLANLKRTFLSLSKFNEAMCARMSVLATGPEKLNDRLLNACHQNYLFIYALEFISESSGVISH